ncbi:MAG: hypothetical protein RDU41_09190 [Clostridia bacterium]|nr:hypothetical protein [Clostridia bacterium]
MTEFKRDGDEILIQHPDDPASWGHYCFATKIALTGPTTIQVGVPATYRVEYRDWQDNLLPNESRPIRIRAGEIESVVEPIVGAGEFDLVVDYVFDKLIIEVCGDGFGCDRGVLEVVVVE